MEILLEEKKLPVKRLATAKKPRAKSHPTLKKLKEDLHLVMRHHGMSAAHSKHGIKMMEGAGLFDSLISAVKKGVSLYNEHKDTIHKVANAVVKHAPKAIKAYKGFKEDGVRGAVASALGGARSAGARSAGAKKRTLPKAAGAWVEKCKKYAAEHKCSYKEAMIACKGK